MIWFMLFVSVTLGALGQVFMKVAMVKVGPIPLTAILEGKTTTGIGSNLWQLFNYFMDALFSIPMITAVFCYGISYIIWLGILSRTDLSFARPFVSFGYIIVILYGYYAGEAMSFERLLGIGLIVAGLVFVARSGM